MSNVNQNCKQSGCFLRACAEQASPYCFPHAVLEAAFLGLAMVDQDQFDLYGRRGFRHFALGYVVGGIHRSGIYYYVPLWQMARVN